MKANPKAGSACGIFIYVTQHTLFNQTQSFQVDPTFEICESHPKHNICRLYRCLCQGFANHVGMSKFLAFILVVFTDLCR